ncbi:MAG: hypothetical protein R3B60_03135 [Candidatus Paceibacterota bacterium]
MEEPTIKPLSYTHRNFIFISAVVLFVLSLPVFIFYAIGYRYTVVSDEPIITATGGLYLANEYDGAIYIDETEVTGKTRLFSKSYYIQGIEPGLHRVHVQSPELHTWVKELMVISQVVIEAEAFNLPLTPQLRPVTEFETTDGEAVYFKNKPAILTSASSSLPYIISTSTATSTYEVNPEYVLLKDLFFEKASTTALLNKIEASKNQSKFNFATDGLVIDYSSSTATSTIKHDDLQLYKKNEDVFVAILPETKRPPYYFCETKLSDVAKSRMSFIGFSKNQEEIESYDATNILSDSEQERSCRNEIMIDRMGKRVIDFNFLPTGSNLVLLQLEDGIYVTEIDDRSWQNSQLLYLGTDLEMIIYGGAIFVNDNGQYFEVFTELIGG